MDAYLQGVGVVFVLRPEELPRPITGVAVGAKTEGFQLFHRIIATLERTRRQKRIVVEGPSSGMKRV